MKQPGGISPSSGRVAAGRPVDLVAFDVDGTLVSSRSGRVVWQILLERFGCPESADTGRYAAFLAGEITYAEWVDLDIGDWVAAGATRAQIVEAVEGELLLTEGARDVVIELKARGYHLAVVSGTIDVVLDVLFPSHPFEQVFTNRIAFDAEGRIASWQATPYDMDGKRVGLAEAAKQAGVSPERCAFVGDNINDLSAMGLAGLPIAYDPKHDSVREAAEVVLPAGRFRDLLELLP